MVSIRRRLIRVCGALLATGGLLLTGAHCADSGAKGVWTNPDDPSLPKDFLIQGEYVGTGADGNKLGCQVIALGKGQFQAVVYSAGLPGAGWDGKSRTLLHGELKGEKAEFREIAADESRKYLAGPADQFSAAAKFPPDGHQPESSGSADGKTFSGKLGSGSQFSLKKTDRVSPSMAAEAPAGAKVLFDGTDTEAWRGGRLDEKTKLLNTDGRDILTKDKFNNYTMHVEFMLPYRPDARGQGRGNSGFYQVDHYEVQILDSFGLEGKNNECGGIYSKAAPDLNMCAPPLSWQSYDVDFTNAVTDDNGKVTKPAVITVKLNGVVIHDKLEINGKTGGSRSEPVGTPGPIKLQGHGNPLQFRNIWIVKK